MFIEKRGKRQIHERKCSEELNDENTITKVITSYKGKKTGH